jgi:shikimate kinase
VVIVARKPKNVILLGFMGSGKSTVGKLLAKKLGFGFIDIDKVVERKYGKTVEELFKEKGEEFFRDEETNAVRELQGKRARVIATGGGIVEREENVKLLQKLGVVVYLCASVDEIYKRTHNSATRPLLNVENRREVIENLLSLASRYLL